VHGKISAGVDRMQGGGSSVRRPGREDPISASENFLFFIVLLFKSTEGVVIGFQIFAWEPNPQKYYDSNPKKYFRGE
jgi:hypothetical protein